ncbi:mannan-binding lectin serine protease 1-like [Drosophila sulfurigaster albostrigata]|uniref:mannan-binding lectin serine protease 1-like n=1 Tax=Drosophila sulfurigaster albostrigata TaxID=89887 RepID=UPI002D21D972|nr:mannan-binding lectin serine protease 1-like [Drosophila sulfurigaster albostrigata]
MVKQWSWLLIFLTSLILFWNIPAEHLALKWAIPKQFPYQVFYSIANYSQTDQQWSPQCSGTIFAKNGIGTAASCLDTKFDLIRIYFGAVNISNPCEIGQTQVTLNRSEIGFVRYADYNPVTLENNIGIIVLPYDLEFNEYVQAALLPRKSDISSYAGQNMIISGWHKSYKNSADIVLGFVETKVTKFGKDLSILRYKKELADVANVGSPIVIHNANESQNIVVGMFAASKAHLKHMKRGFFVNLYQYIKWILDLIKGKINAIG